MSLYFGLGAVALGFAGLYLAGTELLDGYRSHRRSETLKSAETTHPADATPGETACVVGTAAADDPLDVPIGDDGDCVAFYLDTFVGPNEDGFPYDKDTEAVPFRLEGHGHAVHVDPENIAVETTADRVETYSSSTLFDDNPEDLPDDLLAFFEDEGIPEPEGFGGVNYTRKHVPVGEEVCVHGAVEQRDGELVLTDGDGPFFVTDAPPEEFLERQPSVLARTAKESGLYLGLSVVSLVVGVVLVVV